MSSPSHDTAQSQPALTIGVMGQSGGPFVEGALEKARAVGRAIARRGCTLITGACPGLPLEAARGAKEAGGLTLGISPALSRREHIGRYQSPTEYHDVIVYTGSGLMGREVDNIRSSDMVVIAGGHSGTLGEFAIAYDEGKIIGVIDGSGGITAILPEVVEVCKKDTGSVIIYESDPDTLVDLLLEAYQSSASELTATIPTAGEGAMR